MDRDYISEALEAKRSGKAKYETPEDALMAALDMLADDERGVRMKGHASGMRGEMAPMAEEMAEGEEMLPPECAAGMCDHPEHQREDMLPDGLEG